MRPGDVVMTVRPTEDRMTGEPVEAGRLFDVTRGCQGWQGRCHVRDTKTGSTVYCITDRSVVVL